MKVKSESDVAQSCPTPSDPMDCSLPGPSVHGFSRQEYWSWVQLPSPHENARLDESQVGIKISRRNIYNLRYADDTTLMAESEEELQSLLMRVKEESEKAGLKLNIQKAKIMASDPITSWHIEWGKVETLIDFIFLGFKITADSDCSCEIKR